MSDDDSEQGDDGYGREEIDKNDDSDE